MPGWWTRWWKRRLLEIVTPEQIELALAAADELTQREARSLRAFELRAERARYEATRAERAFHLCEPENRLVARSLEQRWEAKLATVAEAEAAVETQRTQRSPLPHKAELETLAADLRRLWNEPTTSPRDRKRVLRTLITAVTLTSDPTGHAVRAGIAKRRQPLQRRIVAPALRSHLQQIHIGTRIQHDGHTGRLRRFPHGCNF